MTTESYEELRQAIYEQAAPLSDRQLERVDEAVAILDEVFGYANEYKPLGGESPNIPAYGTGE